MVERDTLVHMMVERSAKQGVVVKCGARVSWATIWHSDVTCPECLDTMWSAAATKRLVTDEPTPKPRKRLIPRSY